MKNQSIIVDRTAFEQMVQASAAYQKAVNEVFASLRIEQPEIKDEWITTKETRQITGISTEKLSRMARLGECEAKRVGMDYVCYHGPPCHLCHTEDLNRFPSCLQRYFAISRPSFAAVGSPPPGVVHWPIMAKC